MSKNHFKTGERLKECIELRGFKQKKLLNKILEKYGIEIKKDKLSRYINQGLSIPEKHLEAIADCLNIHKGYLLLDDDEMCKTYYEYCDLMALMSDANFTKYHNMLYAAGFVMGSGLDSEREGKREYRCKDNRFTSSDIERFYEIITDCIKQSMESYKDCDHFPNDINDYDSWSDFFYWHPDFFEEHEGFDHLLKHRNIKKAWDLRKTKRVWKLEKEDKK